MAWLNTIRCGTEKVPGVFVYRAGSFESLGTFQTQTVKLLKTPYQEFRFPPVKVKYLKLKVRSTYGGPAPIVSEVQLFGRLDPE